MVGRDWSEEKGAGQAERQPRALEDLESRLTRIAARAESAGDVLAAANDAIHGGNNLATLGGPAQTAKSAPTRSGSLPSVLEQVERLDAAMERIAAQARRVSEV